jgi:hypothetical protein
MPFAIKDLNQHSPFDQGRDAAILGLHPSDNPHPVFGWHGKQWAAGFELECRDDIEVMKAYRRAA